MQKILQGSALLLVMVTGSAGAQTRDTLHTTEPFFVGRDAVLAAGFFAATAATAPVDRWFIRQFQDEARQASRYMQLTSAGVRFWGNPGAFLAGAGIYLAGTAAGDRRMQDLGLHAAGSVAIANTITGSIKLLAGRTRPYVDSSNARNFELFRGFRNGDYRSFPSGHATAAFAFASLVSAETSHWWPGMRWPIGLLAYGTATLTGASRLYHYEHWASDVIAGAAIGTLTGLKVFRHQHSHPGNRVDRTFLRAGLQSQGNGWGVMIVPGRY